MEMILPYLLETNSALALLRKVVANGCFEIVFIWRDANKRGYTSRDLNFAFGAAHMAVLRRVGHNQDFGKC